MNRILVSVAVVLALLSVAITGYIWTQSEAAQKRTEASIAQLKSQADRAEQQIAQVRQKLTALQVPTAQAQIAPGVTTPIQVDPQATSSSIPERSKTPEGPVLTSSMREVLVTIDQCTLSNRS